MPHTRSSAAQPPLYGEQLTIPGASNDAEAPKPDPLKASALKGRKGQLMQVLSLTREDFQSTNAFWIQMAAMSS